MLGKAEKYLIYIVTALCLCISYLHNCKFQNDIKILKDENFRLSCMLKGTEMQLGWHQDGERIRLRSMNASSSCSSEKKEF